jgi:hypothetical protein
MSAGSEATDPAVLALAARRSMRPFSPYRGWERSRAAMAGSLAGARLPAGADTSGARFAAASRLYGSRTERGTPAPRAAGHPALRLPMPALTPDQKRRLTLGLGVLAIILGIVVLVLDQRRGEGLQAAGILPIVLGLLAIASARRARSL